MTPRYKFTLICPRCDKTAETINDKFTPSPHVNCGDCLMDFTEIVEMKVVGVHQIDGTDNRFVDNNLEWLKKE